MSVAARSSIYPTGSLVRLRGRDWVVLPSQEQDVLLLRPLTGGEDQITGIFLPIEGKEIKPATFDLPTPSRPATPPAASSCAMPRGSACAPGQPFRSLGRSPCSPTLPVRPVNHGAAPRPVRLLIADDVGVGKPSRPP